MLILDGVDVYPLVDRLGMFLFLFFSMVRDDTRGVSRSELFDLPVTPGKQGPLAGHHLFDAIGEVLPRSFRNREVRSQVEEHPLPWSPFGSHRFDEFEGVVRFPILVGVGDLPDVHGGMVPCRGWAVNISHLYFGTTSPILDRLCV